MDRTLEELNQEFVQLERRLETLTRLRYLELGDAAGAEFGQLLLSGQIISQLAAGTAPLSVLSNTMVPNLNADLLDGNEASAFSIAGHTHAESAITFTDITTNDVSITKHGYVPKAPNDTSKFMRGDGAWAAPTATVADGSITLAKMADLVDQRIIGRAAGSPGVPQALTVSGAGGITVSLAGGALALSIADSALLPRKLYLNTSRLVGRTSAGGGDGEEIGVSGTGGITMSMAAYTLTATIADGALTLAKMADLTDDNLIGRAAGSAGAPQAIGVAEQRLVGRITGGHIDDLTVTQVKALIGDVTIAVPGLCPTAPNDAAKFFRGDAVWATLPVAAGAVPLQPTGNIIINDTGGAFDFTIESDTNANMFSLGGTLNTLGIGAAAVATDANGIGMFQVTAPASTHAASFHTQTAGYGLYSVNSVAEGTASGGNVAVQGGFTPSAADKRIGLFGFRAITTGTTSAQGASISAHSMAAWGSGDAGTYVRHNVTPVGSASAVEVFRVYSTGIQMAAGKNISTDTTTGLIIGTATNQKVSVFNATPAVQAAHIADPTGGAVVDTQCRAALVSLLTAIENFGPVAKV
jgi:hypothetical protein